MTAKTMPRPRHCKKTKENAAIEHKINDRTTVVAVTSRELKTKRPMGARSAASP